MDDKGIERLPDLRLDSLISNPRVVIMPESEIFNPSHSLLNSEIESIIHLGAIASTAKEVSRFELFSKNVFFTEKLFRFANLSKSRVIYSSSMAVYGNSNSDLPMRGIEPLNNYGLSKIKCEQIASRYSSVPSIGLRLCNVYGMNEFHKEDMVSVPLNMYLEARNQNSVSIYRHPRNEVTHEKETSRDFIQVSDVCTLIFNLYTSEDLTGIYDVGTSTSLELSRIVPLIQRFFPAVRILEQDYPGNSQRYQRYTKANLDWIANLKVKWSPALPEIGILKYFENLSLNGH